MIKNFVDFSGKCVLITGGTRGIGLETGLSFGKRGASCVLTYLWGDHDEAAIFEAFREVNAPKPLIRQADVSNITDTVSLLREIKEEFSEIHAFVSNVSSSMIIKTFEDYTLKGLTKSLSYSTWPMVSYTKEIRAVFGKYPKYVIGVSSNGPDDYLIGYDFVAASKTVLEVFVKYLNYRLRKENVCINAVRTRAIKTQSLDNTFGKELEAFAETLLPESYWIRAEEFSEAIVGLCSGYCDTISGQTIMVDRGTAFFDNIMDMYTKFKNRNDSADKA